MKTSTTLVLFLCIATLTGCNEKGPLNGSEDEGIAFITAICGATPVHGQRPVRI